MRGVALGALTAAALAGALAGATLWRAGVREARAAALHPAPGAFITVDGARLHYVEAGAGPAVVLIHGANGTQADMMLALGARLAARYRVIAFDRPGMGHSDPLPAGNETLAAQARALSAAAAALGAPAPLLVGSSYGGTVALAWALDHPAAGLVTLGSPSLPWPGELDPWYRVNRTALGRAILLPLVAAWVPEGVIAASVERVFAPAPVPPGYLAALGPDLLLRRGALAANLAQITALRPQVVAMEPRLPALTLPFEMVHGERDSIVPLAIHSAPLAARLPAARLTVIPGGGHMPHHSHPEVVEAALDRAAAAAGLRPAPGPATLP
jgi:pimeloyl-ACP methyl ester carboxylesterase